MNKTFCDKCGDEMGVDSVSVTYRADVPVGELRLSSIYAYKHLCSVCKQEFLELLDKFVPNFFMGEMTSNRISK